MSKVDERIVQMTFENHLFERNANTSIQTLEKLNNALKLEGASKSLQDVEKTVSTIDMSKLSSDIDTLTKRFSTLGVVGMTVIQNITNSLLNTATGALSKWYNGTIGQIMSGGWSRATNIDQAKFKLEGLGIAFNDIQQNISDAVQDTAYGFDEAAQAAAQLAASGLKYGDATSQMARALKAISGVAAMTNTTYSETAHIFTQIAGQGRVMTYQLRMLENRGLNTAAEIAKAMGTTEEAVREMVTKGELDADTFFSKMYDAYAEFATKANFTYEGSLANMKAALSRIGQPFFEPYRAGMVNVHNAWKAFYKAVKEEGLVPSGVYEEATRLITNITNLKSTLISSIPTEPILYAASAVKEVLASINGGLESLFPFLDKLLPKNKEAAESTKELGEASEETAKSIDELAEAVIRGEYGNGQERIDKLDVLYKTVQNRVNEMLGCSKRYEISQEEAAAVTEKLGGAIGDTVKETKQYKYLADELSDVIGHATHNVEEARKEFLMQKQLDKVASFVAGITSVFNVLGRTVLSVAKGAIDPFGKLFTAMGKGVLSIADKAGKKLTKFRESLEQSGFYGKVEKASGAVFGFISDTLINIGKGGEKAFSVLESGFGKVKDVAGQAKDRFVEFFGAFKNTSAYKRLSDGFERIKSKVLEIKKSALDVVNDAINKFIGKDIALPKIDASGFAEAVSDKIEWILDRFGDIKESIKGFFDSHIGNDSIFGSISDFFGSITLSGVIETFTEQIGKAKDAIQNFITTIKEADILGTISGVLSAFFGNRVEDIKKLGDNLSDGAKGVKDFFGNFKEATVERIKNFIPKALDGLFEVLKIVRRISMFKGFIGIMNSIWGIGRILANVAYTIKMAGKIEKGIFRALSGFALLEIAVSIGILAASLVALSNVPADKLQAAGLAMAGLAIGLTLILLAMSKFTKNSQGQVIKNPIDKFFNGIKRSLNEFMKRAGTAALILAFAASVTLLINALKQLSFFSGEDILRGIGTIGFLLTELVVAIVALDRLTGYSNSIGDAAAILVLAFGVKMLADAVIKLGELDDAGLVKGLFAVTAIGLILGGLMTVSKKAGKGSVASILALIAPILELTGALVILSLLPTEKVLGAALALGGVMAVFSLLLSQVSKMQGMGKGSIASIALLGLFVAELGLILARLSGPEFDGDKMLKVSASLSLLIGVLTLALKGLSGLGGTGVAGMSASAFAALDFGIFTTITAIFGELVLGIIEFGGYLNGAIPEDVWNQIDEGLGRFEDLLGHIGGFLGSAVGGIANGYNDASTKDLPKVGTRLGEFAKNAAPMFDGSTKFSTESFDAIVETLGKLVDAGFTEVVADIKAKVFTEDSALLNLGKDLNEFGTEMVAYGEKMTGLKTDVVTKTSKAINSVMKYLEIANNVGTLDDIFGNNKLKDLVDNLNECTEGLITYSENMAGFKSDTVSKTSAAVQTIMEYANNVPESGGWLEAWGITGNNDLSTFAEELGPFAAALVPYSWLMALVNTNAIEGTKTAIDIVMAYAEKAPKSDSALSWWIGRPSLKTLGEELEPFATGLVKYSQQVGSESFNSEAITNTESAIKVVLALADAVPTSNSGSLLSLITGDNSISKWGGELVRFGVSLVGYSSIVSGVDFQPAIDAVDQINELVQGFVDIDSSRAGTDTEAAGFFIANITGWIANSFKDLTEGLAGKTENIDVSSIQEAGKKLLGAVVDGIKEGASMELTGKDDTSGLAEALMKSFTNEETISKAGDDFAGNIIGAFKTKLDEKVTELNPSVNEILKSIVGVIESSKDAQGGFADKAVEILIMVGDIIADDTGVPSSVGVLCQAAVDAAQSYVPNFVGIGGNMMAGLAAGVTMNSAVVTSAVSAAMQSGINAAKAQIDSHSPSKVFMKIGGWMMEGAGIGITNGEHYAIDAVSSAASHTVSAMTNALGDNQSRIDEKMQDVFRYLESAYAYINSVISDSLDVQPTITPVVDLSQIQNGLNNANGLFANSGLPFGMNSLNYARSMWPGSYQYGAQQIQASQQAGVISAIRGIRSDLAYLGESIQNMQMVMDSGAVVGSIGGGMDRELGKIQMYKERWA